MDIIRNLLSSALSSESEIKTQSEEPPASVPVDAVPTEDLPLPAPAPSNPAVPPPPSSSSSSSAPAPAERKEAPKILDLVFCVDNTASMGEYISAAQQNIRSIIERIVSSEGCDVRFGLVTYRDHPPQEGTYVVRSLDFTSSRARIQEYVDSMAAVGGGDGPEAVADGLHAVLQMPYRKEATKICIFIADAPPHGLEVSDGFPDGCPCGHDPIQVCRQLAEAGVTVYSVGCEPALGSYALARDFMLSVARITGGQAVVLGSAALLADLILGGAMEELQLEQLMNEVEAEVRQLEVSGGAVEREEVAKHVWSKMKERGVRTKQVVHDSKIDSPYEADLVNATSLSSAKAAIHAKAPALFSAPAISSARPSLRSRSDWCVPAALASPIPPPPGAGAPPPPPPPGGFFGFGAAAPSSSASSSSFAPMSAPAPMSSSVKSASSCAVMDDEISLEQVSRMVHKSAARSKKW
eukprot:GILI01000558.1.p1 GENE.GILI01000558.1~~GILI01000558.1.p1  ORF type:complete len:492 (+),score=116.48 GILI01000558.1:81-1478(+)